MQTDGTNMNHWFHADLNLNHVFELTPKRLQLLGFTAVISDLDNTVADYATLEPDDQVRMWLKSLREAGIQVAIVSNNKESRVRRFCEGLDIPFFWRSGKPRRSWILRAMQELGASREKTCLVGDKLVTDVWGARRCGLFCVLVPSISKQRRKEAKR